MAEYTDNINGLNMPYSLDAEQSVLGSILKEPESLVRAIPLLKSEYFYMPQHRDIYSVLVSLDMLNVRIDALVVLEELKKNGVFDDESGKTYLLQLAQSVLSTANIEAYCKIIREKYYTRTLITVSKEIMDMAAAGESDADMLIDSAEQKIYDIRRGKTSFAPKKLSDLISGDVFVRLTEISGEGAEEHRAISTGFSSLDNILTGYNKSDLVLIGARPGMGKTAIALNMARSISRSRKVLFFSREMSAEQLAQRVLSSESRINSKKLQTGELSDTDWITLTQALSDLSPCELYFDDTANITVPEMKAKIRYQRNVDCVFIDYLGLMSSPKKTENRVQEVSEITRSLKLMAKELRIPVVVCAQLSRGPEAKSGRSSRRPVLSDLRDSGSIEQDADVVMLLYRENYYDNEAAPVEGAVVTAELNVAKNRHGPTGVVELMWNGECSLFTAKDKQFDE